jgi:hypothetical protein
VPVRKNPAPASNSALLMAMRENTCLGTVDSSDISIQARAVSIAAPAVHHATYLDRVSKYLARSRKITAT